MAIAAGFATVAISPWAIVAPAMIVLGFGIHMLHNTLQSNATQMAPEARGLAVSTFANVLFIGQAAGVWLSGLVIDRIGYPPVCIAAGAALLVVGAAFALLLDAARRPAERSRTRALPPRNLSSSVPFRLGFARCRVMRVESAAKFGNRENTTMAVKSVNDLLIDELQDIYHAEKQLVKALPKMAKKAKSDKLRQAVEHHLEETKGHVQRLEQVFEKLDAKPRAKKCEAMEGLIEEAEELMEEIATPEVLDAAMISRRPESRALRDRELRHLEHARRRNWAHTEAARLLEQTLNEEKAADQKLNEIALSGVNKSALQAAA